MRNTKIDMGWCGKGETDLFNLIDYTALDKA